MKKLETRYLSGDDSGFNVNLMCDTNCDALAFNFSKENILVWCSLPSPLYKNHSRGEHQTLFLVYINLCKCDPNVKLKHSDYPFCSSTLVAQSRRRKQ